MHGGLAKSLDTSWALRCLVLALLYFGAAELSLGLAIPPGYAAPIWPSSGIAAGALAIWGFRLWPGVWAGAALANYTVDGSTGLATWIATGNTLEAACAVWLARRLVNPQIEFKRPEVVVIFAFAAGLSGLVAASLAMPRLYNFEAVRGGQLPVNWFTWWLGDTAGILVYMPLVLAWARPAQSYGKPVRAMEAAAFSALLALTLYLVFWGEPAAIARRPGAFMALVFVVWAGCRFELRAIASLAAGLVVIVAGTTSLGYGPFALEDANESLLFLNGFASAAAVVGLALHALRRQRDDPTFDLLRVRERQLAEAQRLARIGSWHWDVKDNGVSWSDELYTLFGRIPGSPQTYESYLGIVHAEDREAVDNAIRNALQTRAPFSHEYRIRLPSGEVRHMHARGFVDAEPGGEVTGLHGTCQDVTEQKAAGAREKATEERFRALVEHLRDYAIVMLDAEGRVTSWNIGAERMKGYRADEILGKHFSCFYPPEAGSRAADDQLRAALREGHLEREEWRLKKDGQRFWANVAITPMLDEEGRLRGYAKITRDMTERKQAEEDLRSYASRLMSTSRRLLEVQEAERRRLAGELHDRVGPNLTALGIKLELLESGMSPESRAVAAGVIEDCKTLLQETVAATRAVMGELRPQVLVDYGLVAALRAMASGFTRRTGISTTVQEADGVTRLPHSIELAMFRIAQETLNNVGKHSHAKRVELRYATRAGVATLDIHDDGIGFEHGHLEHSASHSGWGLIIMRERAEAVGARLTLEASPGRGVLVRVSYRI